jgi:hypothetical protein
MVLGGTTALPQPGQQHARRPGAGSAPGGGGVARGGVGDVLLGGVAVGSGPARDALR